uniref:Uncharacterized protein n=1 Tax=viral metagenome TaxID=1070528 RepID=A0A6C0EPF5_9ZZZZ
MEIVSKQPDLSSQKNKKRENRVSSIYSRCLISRNINLPIVSIGKNIKDTIEKCIAHNFEGKCIIEGFVKPGSSKLVSHSSGLINRGTDISFEVVFECEVCFPVEGMLISCVAKNITKAGIKAEAENEYPSPVVIFIAKDHHHNVLYFSEIKEGDKFNTRVIGQRFELNDNYVSVIGELVKPKSDKYVMKKNFTKAKLVIED